MSNEIDTVAVLIKQIEEYEKMKQFATDDKVFKNLDDQIQKTEYIIDCYEAAQAQIESGINLAASLSYPLILAGVVDAIALFNTLNYKLSAELLSESFYNSDITRTYEPVYGGRVISSRLTDEIAMGVDTNGSNTYSSKASRNEEDLAFAIHSFDYEKESASSRKIIITDTYDFAFMQLQTDGALAIFNNVIYEAQEVGIVGPYQVRIEVDMDEPLGLEVISESGSNYSIRLTNKTNEEKEIFYNNKMCFEDDARTWSGLSNIMSIKIRANGASVVTVKKMARRRILVFVT